MSLARSSASSCVKSPEITAVPSNDVNAASLGWIAGADCTTPSSTIATCLWNCGCASASHFALPDVGEVHLDGPALRPDWNSALAVSTSPCR